MIYTANSRGPLFLRIVPMPKWLTICVTMICLICVVTICVAPELDLPDTVLRATQFGLLLLLATVALASLRTGQLLALPPKSNIGGTRSEATHIERFLPEPERSCIFLC